MKSKSNNRVILLKVVFLSAYFLMGLTLRHQQVAAAPLPAVTISPFLQEVRFSGADPTKEFTVSITNNSISAQSFKLSVLDFGSLNDSGGIVYAGSQVSSLVKKYGLATWLQLSEPELTLEGGAKAEITATIINDTSLSPGGHYAAIVASVINPEEESAGQISINQKLSSLILATKVGGEKYDLKLNTITVQNNIFHLPNNVLLSFKNPGNVHVVPRGIVKIKNLSDKVILQGVINEESAFVLPETTRQLAVELHMLAGQNLRPGFYRVEVDYRYDGIDNFAHKTKLVYFANLPALFMTTALTGILLWGVLYLRKKPKVKKDVKPKPQPRIYRG